MKARWQYGVLSCLLVWSLASQLSSSISSISDYVERSGELAFPYVRENTSSTVIEKVQDQYRSSGLQPGDNVLGLNEHPFNGLAMTELMHLHPGDTLRVKVARQTSAGRKVMDVSIRMQPGLNKQISWEVLIGLRLLLPVSCLLVGFYIAFARPYDKLAWITMATLLSFGHITQGYTPKLISPPWRELMFVYNPILSNCWPFCLLCFALYFPQPFAWIRKSYWILWLAGAIVFPLAAIDIYTNFMIGTHLRDLEWVGRFDTIVNQPVTVLFTMMIFGFFFLLSWKQRILVSPDAQRRMRLLIKGCTLALLPLLPVAFSGVGLLPTIPEWLQTLLLLMLLLFPATMAYVIVVQRAMEVRMVIRSGVRYAIASRSLRVLQILVVAAVAILTDHFVHQSGRRMEAILVGIAGIAFVFLSRRLEKEAAGWVDRHFFREAYNAKLLLTELSNSVATLRDMAVLVETVANRIAASLHVDQVAVLLGQNNRFQPVYALGFSGVAPPTFQPGPATLRLVHEMSAPARIYFDDPHSWVHETSAHDRSALQQLGTQVLLPVTRRDSLLGIISLGAKRSEEPYSPEDLQLLGALASQTGLALENAKLTEDIREQIAERERLDRELEIAREVQQRLFPQILPCIPFLDLAGYCRPALEVGGDYYDFLKLPNGCLGIAVGDVSGKGIAAALMMASLQASLRGQTLSRNPSLAEMIRNVNSLMYEASAANRYATFFYAEYEPLTSRLRYVNAGHNPPFIYRKMPAGEQVIRLEQGGTVVGLFASAEFSEGELPLLPGDLLIAFTDGISEAMNANDDEFGEERLLGQVRDGAPQTAASLIQWLLAEVDSFTGSAPQHDDMTLVAMRVGKPTSSASV